MAYWSQECLIGKLTDKNNPVFKHGKRVAQIACAIAVAMGYGEDKMVELYKAAAAHDIGKLGLPSKILNKASVLNKEEITAMHRHPEFGHSLIKQVLRADSVIAQVALQHHERLDGSGYPFGLRADSIILEAKIVAVSDVIAAMTSAKPYRKALTAEQALQELKQNSGILYDPDVVVAAMQIAEEGKLKGLPAEN